jgi:putative salt-induced outer membrane protein YdiY
MVRRDRHRFQMDARLNRGEANGELAVQNAAGTLKYDYLLSRQFYLSGQQLVENDRFQELNVRSTTSAALGYDFFDRASHSLSLGAGPALVYEDFSTTATTINPSAMWYVRWRRDIRGGDVTLFHRHQGFRDLGGAWATRLNAEQGIRVKVYGDISFNFEYDIRFNSQPVEGRKSVDSTLIFGLSYGFER